MCGQVRGARPPMVTWMPFSGAAVKNRRTSFVAAPRASNSRAGRRTPLCSGRRREEAALPAAAGP